MLHLSMNSLNQTQTAIFTLLLHLLLPADHITRIYLPYTFRFRKLFITPISKYLFQGIGREITRKLVELGAETVALSRTQADLDSLKLEVSVHSYR